MASILYLEKNNFVIIGTRDKVLGINLEGIVLVYFKMSGDKNCASFDPTFARLAQKDQRVTCAILDVTSNRDVVVWARQTKTPISAVPLLILYVNGRPHAKFNGAKNERSLESFITGALQPVRDVAPRQDFMRGPAHAPAPAPTMHRGANMYGGEGGGQKAWEPEIGKAPSMKGIIKGGGRGHMNMVEDEEEPMLLIPDGIVPHNTPWEAEMDN